MPAVSSSRSMRVDAALVQGMTRDAVVYTLTRPLALVAYAALGSAVVLTAIALSTALRAQPDQVGRFTLTLILLVAVIAGSVLLSRSSTRRALLAAMPPGSIVSVALGDDSIRVESAQGLSDVRYSTFRSVRVGRDAVLLRLRGASALTALPRPLISDEDIALLRSKIG